MGKKSKKKAVSVLVNTQFESTQGDGDDDTSTQIVKGKKKAGVKRKKKQAVTAENNDNENFEQQFESIADSIYDETSTSIPTSNSVSTKTKAIPKMKKKKGGKKKTVVLERTSDDVPIADGEPVFESVQSQESAVSVHNTAAPSSTERPDLEDIGNDLAKKKKKHTKKKNKVNEKEE